MDVTMDKSCLMKAATVFANNVRQSVDRCEWRTGLGVDEGRKLKIGKKSGGTWLSRQRAPAG
jgi:hypothetical protein